MREKESIIYYLGMKTSGNKLGILVNFGRMQLEYKRLVFYY